MVDLSVFAYDADVRATATVAPSGTAHDDYDVTRFCFVETGVLRPSLSGKLLGGLRDTSAAHAADAGISKHLRDGGCAAEPPTAQSVAVSPELISDMLFGGTQVGCVLFAPGTPQASRPVIYRLAFV